MRPADLTAAESRVFGASRTPAAATNAPIASSHSRVVVTKNASAGEAAVYETLQARDGTRTTPPSTMVVVRASDQPFRRCRHAATSMRHGQLRQNCSPTASDQ